MLASFHPTVARWFAETLGEPSEPQRAAWPLIQQGGHVLVAAPTGTGKTLTAFLHAIDQLLRAGTALRDELHVVYVSPLRALANDVQKNLLQPLAELRARDPSLPTIRVMVRSGDTPQNERAAMLRKAPHILVTTPESLYILVTTQGGRRMLASARTLIVDEIHALMGNKRGSHLALTCERLQRLVTQAGGTLQRIGLSATQRPIEQTAKLLVGSDRACRIVDVGHRRKLDVALQVPGAPLDTVCPTETWNEVLDQVAKLVQGCKSAIVFTNTRKLAERVAARLAERIGKEHVTSHHGSLAKERRLDAEQRLKRGELKALVATNSLELGIDVGDIDLVVQIGATASIAALLQRIGRAGHALGKTPVGRLFPLTRDDLVACSALLLAIARGELDRVMMVSNPLDILAQQAVAAAASETLPEDELFALTRCAAPFAELTRERFDAVLNMHAQGRRALLFRDPIHRTLRGTKRARLTAITSGGAIPDVADWHVVLDHDETRIGTVHEDFAIESSIGDIFQLGAASWRVVRISSGTLRVQDAKGAPPSLPFWVAEGPSRTNELSQLVSELRERGVSPLWLRNIPGLPEAAIDQLSEYLRAGAEALGGTPTQQHLMLERFFDETGGQQLILHSPYGSRINRAFGLALRKRFCVGFGYELQAAATEEAVLISLGPMHSFTLADVWTYLHSASAEKVLVQAILPAPMFTTRWRWNVTRSLLVERFSSGKKTPAPLLRFRANDALALAFPGALACPETLPPGPIEVPEGHPLVDQTIADCMQEAMDLAGFLALLSKIERGELRLSECDRDQPSPFADGILHAMPYAFLDDAPLEERRTQAVQRGQRTGQHQREGNNDLEPSLVAMVQEQCWPDPASSDELHEALSWMGWLAAHEVPDLWGQWLHELLADGRAEAHGERYFAAGADRSPIGRWRGRLEAQFPAYHDTLDDDDQQALLALQAEGVAMHGTCGGRPFFAHRRLLARARNLWLEKLRAAVAPVSPAVFDQFLQAWQRRAPDGHRLALPQALTLHASGAYCARDWETDVLPPCVHDYQQAELDALTTGGEFVWLRLWSPWRAALRKCTISIVPRQELHLWLQLPQERFAAEGLSADARQVHQALASTGAQFPADIQRQGKLLPIQVEAALAELIGLGLASCDSFAAMRQLAIPASRRTFPVRTAGRIFLLPRPSEVAPSSPEAIALVVQSALHRFGVVSHTLLQQHRFPVPWRLLLRELRAMELSGHVRGGRFVLGWTGEQYALPSAVTLLRSVRDRHSTVSLV